jgi:hypothetical protein
MVFVTRYSVVGDRVSPPAVFALGLRSVLLCDRPTLVRPLAGAASGVAGRGCRWSEALSQGVVATFSRGCPRWWVVENSLWAVSLSSVVDCWSS